MLPARQRSSSAASPEHHASGVLSGGQGRSWARTIDQRLRGRFGLAAEAGRGEAELACERAVEGGLGLVADIAGDLGRALRRGAQQSRCEV
jgi:hypothetical protein